MTLIEYKSALEALDDEAFAKFRSAFGGDFKTRQEYVDDFVHFPEHERHICRLLNLKTQEERLVDAAAASARSAHWSMIWAAVSAAYSRYCTVFRTEMMRRQAQPS